MADLRPAGSNGSDRSRGQLILVAAFALAVTFVALALVMNAAIYTENLATRSEAAGLSNAHASQRAASNVFDEAWTYAHEVDNDTTPGGIETNLTAAIADYENVTRRQQAASGSVVNVSVASVTHGTNISGGDGDDFTAPDGSPDEWTVATDASAVRKFSVDVDSTTLVAHGVGSDEFRVVARGTSSRWYFNVSYDSLASEAIVGINNSGSYSECRTGLSTFTINVSAGTVGGDDCPALDLDDAPGTYDLEFRNASSIQGDYELIVDENELGRSVFTTTGPRARAVLYSAEVEFVYRTPDLAYRTTIRIAPGEEYA